MPDNPGAWITTTARNRAIDRLRRERTLREKTGTIAAVEALESLGGGDEVSAIPDDRLRLIFTCCHPALALEARVALTLRTLGGLTTGEIARAFLASRDDDGAAARPGEAEDPRPPASRIASRRPSCCPSAPPACSRCCT